MKVITTTKNNIKSMINLVQINYNPSSLYIPDHPHRVLIIWGSEPVQANVLLNIIKYQRPDIENDFKDSFESKYQLLTERKENLYGREKIGIKKSKTPKTFVD